MCHHVVQYSTDCHINRWQSNLWYCLMTVKPVILSDYSQTCDIVWLQWNLWYCLITVKPVILSDYSQTCDIIWLQSNLWYCLITVKPAELWWDEEASSGGEFITRERKIRRWPAATIITDSSTSEESRTDRWLIQGIYQVITIVNYIHATPYGHVCQWHIFQEIAAYFFVLVRSKGSGFQMLEHKIAT